ncbi:HNH endonuclease [Algoriphagus sp. PAP.12]|uniref:HNH endonuclease n=1 Tax=Algoriphagus sp. PAP.12 TaxID=2996678 RepID=UPI00227B3E07|nr:HNH endonuclease [Algoriphagus sp. PAP.12]
MAKNRSQLFRDLNVSPANKQWAWCAKNTTLKRAVFTLWEDLERPNQQWLIYDVYENYKKAGYYDQKRTIDLSISEDFEIFGIVCVAKDPNAEKRSIVEIKDDFVHILEFVDKGNQIFVRVKKTVPLLEIIRRDQHDLNSENGLQDLDTSNFGSDNPDRALSKGYIIKRDNKVRLAVIKRAKGKCEYCGEGSFKTPNGKNYLEAHHVIFLAKSGTDRMDNVIALCPSHHREAHFGINAEDLEKEFLEILKKK